MGRRSGMEDEVAFVEACEQHRVDEEGPDAIHLATALDWRHARETALVMATHDKALAEAACSVGVQAIGD